MTQCELVLDYMKEHGSITQRDALCLGIYRLASRIADLKKAGFPVESKTVIVVNVDGSKSHIARYSLKKAEKKSEWEALL